MKHVHVEVYRGREFHYFRRGRGKRTRLPHPDSPLFSLAYEDAYEANYRAGSKSERKRKAEVYHSIRRGLIRARDAAAKQQVSFDLNFEWAESLLKAQKFRCAISDIEFFTEHASAARRHPFAPSIDRIKAGGDYTQDNCRIVCHAVNVMLFDWGIDVLKTVARAVA